MKFFILPEQKHGNSKLDIQSCSLNKILQEVHELTYMLAENRNYPFKILQDEEIYVCADPRWLKQILVQMVDIAISRMEEGKITISTKADDQNNVAFIWLDVPSEAILSNEPIDLIESEDEKKMDEEEIKLLQAGMKLLLNQTLLEVMKGKLEIVSYPDNRDEYSRLQISIPLGTQLAELQH